MDRNQINFLKASWAFLFIVSVIYVTLIKFILISITFFGIFLLIFMVNLSFFLFITKKYKENKLKTSYVTISRKKSIIYKVYLVLLFALMLHSFYMTSILRRFFNPIQLLNVFYCIVIIYLIVLNSTFFFYYSRN